ncbi:MAG: hypothetical protein ACLTCP_03315 [Ruminococcus bicirculans (ex Wegman et al. 2014)]
MKYCGKCGAPLNDNQSVCMKCGCPVTSQGSQAAKAETQGLNDKQKKIIAFAFIVVIIALVVMYIINVSDGSALVARKFNSTISQAEKDGKFNSLSFTFDLTGSPEVLDHTGDVYFVYSAKPAQTLATMVSSENGLVFIIGYSYLTGRCSMVSVVPVNGRPDQTYINTWKQIYGGYTN